jgi:hypothetical protein
MKINFDRICRLAGVESRNERRARLTEGASHSYKMEMEKEDASEGMHGQGHMEEYDEMAMEEYDEAAEEEAMKEMFGAYHEEENENVTVSLEENLDEMVEVDPKELMEEIRRAKKLMALRESRKQKEASNSRKLQENHLKRVIRQEIQNIMKDIDNVDNSWVYGNKKPKNSRKGYTSQGRTLPGIGFDKKW